MTFTALLLALTSATIGPVASQAADYGQCGGIGFTGATTCMPGWVCIYENPYHSQCLQNSTTTPATTYTPTPTTYTPLPTLSPAPGWGYVDSDEEIEYFLQSAVLNTASGAVFSAPANASQIQISSSGQLVQNALGKYLYATPEHRANSSVTMLAVSWSTKPAHGVTFWLGRDYITMGINMTGIAKPGFLSCPAAEGDYFNFYINLDNNVFPDGCINSILFFNDGSIVI